MEDIGRSSYFDDDDIIGKALDDANSDDGEEAFNISDGNEGECNDIYYCNQNEGEQSQRKKETVFHYICSDFVFFKAMFNLCTNSLENTTKKRPASAAYADGEPDGGNLPQKQKAI